MKIRMRVTSAGPEGTKLAGGTYSVEEKEGRELVAGGYASTVEEAKPAPKPAPAAQEAAAEGEKETASVEPEEAAADAGRARGRKTAR